MKAQQIWKICQGTRRWRLEVIEIAWNLIFQKVRILWIEDIESCYDAERDRILEDSNHIILERRLGWKVFSRLDGFVFGSCYGCMWDLFGDTRAAAYRIPFRELHGILRRIFIKVVDCIMERGMKKQYWRRSLCIQAAIFLGKILEDLGY